jgi:hypothetical protein
VIAIQVMNPVSKIYLIVVIILFSSSLSAAQILTRTGYVRNPDDNSLLYTEHHYEVYIDNIVSMSSVIYKDKFGNAFAEKTVNFSSSPFLPEFSLQNKATGHQESTRYLDDGYEVRFLQRMNKKAREKSLDYSANAISDAGFDNFVISHWSQITKGEKFNRDFLIPGMLRFFKFRVYQAEVIEITGQTYRMLVIEPDSFILRALSKPTRLYYAVDEPVLKKFKGISNMRDAEGNNYNVVIQYENKLPLVSTLN